jgi:hypothetical protein
MAVFQAAYAGVDVNLDVCGNKIYYVDSLPPTAGTYLVGDLALVVPVPGGVNPTALSPLGYRCVTAGSPGTWVTLGGGADGGSYATVASAASITPTATVLAVTGNTQITTIVATGLLAGAQISLIPTAASTWTTATGGNINLGSTGVQYKVLTMTWDGTGWNPSY